MLYFLSLIILKISIYLAYDFIPLKHFEKKTVHFTLTQNFFIFSYEHVSPPNSTYSTYTLVKYHGDYPYYNCYIYKNLSDIRQNFDGRFINSDKDCALYNVDEYYPTDEKVPSGTYYFVIKISDNKESFTTFMIYSSGIPYNIQNTFYSTFGYKLRELKYIFFPINHAKYIRFGYDRMVGSGDFGLTIYENNETIIFNRTDSEKYEEHLELKESCSYSIYIKLENRFRNNNILCFFVTLSNYSNMLPVEINTENFQDFPSFKGINLLLDMSKIKKNYKMMVEYDSKWKNEKFIIEGYDTEDLHKIDSTSGTELEILKHENCQNTCKDYIVKSSGGIKKAIFKVPKPSIKAYYSFRIRYGDQEYYYGKNIFASLMFGLFLSTPNIIIQILRKKKDKRTANWFTLTMNIFLHFAYGFIIGRYIHIGGDNCLVIGYWFIGIFIFIFLGSILFSWVFKESIPMVQVLFNFFKEVEKLKTAREVFYYYKKLPPKITIEILGKHEESREVWAEYEDVDVTIYTKDINVLNNGGVSSMSYVDHFNQMYVGTYVSEWGRTDQGGGKMNSSMESKRKKCKISVEKRTVTDIINISKYIYESWQDNTNVSDKLFESDYQVIKFMLGSELQFDEEAKEGISKIKDDLITEAKKKENNLEIQEKYNCPELPKDERCYTNESAIQKIKEMKGNIKMLITWIIMVFLGYSSIIEPDYTIAIASENIHIKYIKFVSGTKNYRAGYMKNDENSYDAQSDNDKKGKINDYDFGKDENDNMLEMEKKLIE
jgi:hypothetical protein